MNLRNLSDSAVLTNTKNLARRERELLTEVLHHLREVERRRLFSSLKYKSLFEYAVKELAYSEDQAYRRINAMRLLADLPEIESKISDGTLTLSNLNVVSTALKARRKATNQAMDAGSKLTVIQLVENKSRREAEELVLKYVDLPKHVLKPETIRRHENHVEVRLTISRELEQQIQKLKSQMAHASPQMTTTELFERLCTEELARREKKMQPRAASKIPRHPETLRQKPGRKALPRSAQRFVWQRDRGQCSQCGSVHALEFDHIVPKANGGTDDPINLRVLCRSCNQRSAIEVFGLAKMRRYLEG